MYGYCPLASGSKGNSIVVSNGKHKVLIDAGLSGRATMQRLAELDIDLSEIDAILVTHEHTDHIRGLKVLALKHGIPILANSETAKAICTFLGAVPKFQIFSTGEPFSFKGFEFTPFTIQHDAADPVAFTARFDELKIGFCADLGFATTLVRAHLQECDYLYLEANHEPSMVYASPRPMIYKQRVLGRAGHLSNEACGELLAHVASDRLRHVHLAHLSSECNHPEKALEVVGAAVAHLSIELDVAPQETIGRRIDFGKKNSLIAEAVRE